MSKKRKKPYHKKSQSDKKKSFKVTARFASQKELDLFNTALMIANKSIREPHGYAPIVPQVFAGNCVVEMSHHIIRQYQEKQEKIKQQAESEIEEQTDEGETTNDTDVDTEVSGSGDTDTIEPAETDSEGVSEGPEPEPPEDSGENGESGGE